MSEAVRHDSPVAATAPERRAPPAAPAAPATPGRLLTCRALGLFLALDLACRWVKMARILDLLTRSRPGRTAWPEASGRRQAARTFAAVQRAAMLTYRRRRDCLPKAAATFHLLRRQGLPADLCFGVRKYPFAAHSWVEAYGDPLDDDPPRLAGYTLIHRVTSSPTRR